MKIGIISDSHDRIEETNKAMEVIKEKGATVLIHCGDFCAPFMMNELSKFEGEVHCVFGNIDDRFVTPNRARDLGINFHGDIAELELEGKKIAVNHFQKIAEALASTGVYDAVFHGHTHVAYKKLIGKTLLANPGEIMGWKGKPSLAIYDTESNEIQHLDVK
ncbi:MAG: metallophosphoesterase [Nanoarchaeota archaeon]